MGDEFKRKKKKHVRRPQRNSVSYNQWQFIDKIKQISYGT